jgi:rhamnogalacturonan endolyase
VFLGDTLPSNKSSLDQGSTYYYTTTTDASGHFAIPNVRVGSYGLQAWSGNNSAIGDVSTTFTLSSLTVSKDKETTLGDMTWKISEKKKLFQVGSFDRFSYGFEHGGAPWQHALVASCPANLTYRVGCSSTEDWCFGQSVKGNWTIKFWNFDTASANRSATLIVSLAGYSSGSSSTIWVNDAVVGNLTSGSVGKDGLVTHGLASDPSLYRSATAAGEWRYFEFEVQAGLLKEGKNEVKFQLTRETQWHGFMWDAIKLEW